MKKNINAGLRELQEQRIRETTSKIELALSKLPNEMKKITLSTVIKFVCEETGLHYTTVYKNDMYKEMCNKEFLKRSLNKTLGKTKNKDVDLLRNKNRLLELENANLKNQVISLTNVIQKMEDNGKIAVNKDNESYKEKLEALLNHFKDQLEIRDGKVIDPYSGIRPVVIYQY